MTGSDQASTNRTAPDEPTAALRCSPRALKALMSEPVVVWIDAGADDAAPRAAGAAVLAAETAPDGALLLTRGDGPADIAAALRPAGAILVAVAQAEAAARRWMTEAEAAARQSGRDAPDARFVGDGELPAAIAAAFRDALARRSRLVGALTDEVDSLRLENERHAEVERQRRAASAEARQFGAATVRAAIEAPAEESAVPLGPGADQAGAPYVVSQPLHCAGRGLAGFDLCVMVDDAKAVGAFDCALISHDRRLAIATWTAPFPERSGWMFLPLGETATIDDVFLSLTIQWRAESGRPPRLVARRSAAFVDGAVLVNGDAQTDLFLAHRVWAGVPGEKTSFRAAPGEIATPFYEWRGAETSRHIAGFQTFAFAGGRDKLKCSLLGDDMLVAGPIWGRVSFALSDFIEAGALDNVSQLTLPLFVHEADGVYRARLRLTDGAPRRASRRSPDDTLENELLASEWSTVRGRAVYPLRLETDATMRERIDARARLACVVDLEAQSAGGAPVNANFSVLAPEFDWSPASTAPVWRGAERLTFPGDPHAASAARLFRTRERARVARENGVATAPMASLLCAIHRAEDAARLMTNVNQQLAEAMETVIVINSDALEEAALSRFFMPGRRYRVLRAPEEKNLGHCLNVAAEAAVGDVLLKIDADDLYFPNYVGDAVLGLQTSNADISGKRSSFAYLEASDELYVRFPNHEYSFVEQTFGGTMAIKRALWEAVRFREDTVYGTDLAFFQDSIAHGASVYSADRFNYIYIRYARSDHHTWSADRAAMLGPNPIIVGRWSDRTAAVR